MLSTTSGGKAESTTATTTIQRPLSAFNMRRSSSKTPTDQSQHGHAAPHHAPPGASSPSVHSAMAGSSHEKSGADSASTDRSFLARVKRRFSNAGKKDGAGCVCMAKPICLLLSFVRAASPPCTRSTDTSRPYMHAHAHTSASTLPHAHTRYTHPALRFRTLFQCAGTGGS